MELKKILSGLECPGAEWMGLREVFEQTTDCQVENERPRTNALSTNHGYMLEILKDGNFAWAATSNIRSLQECADKALALTQRKGSLQIHSFSPEHRPPHVGKYRSEDHFSSPSRPVSLSDINDFLIRSCQTMNVSDKIERTWAGARLVESNHRFVSTTGGRYRTTVFLPLIRTKGHGRSPRLRTNSLPQRTRWQCLARAMGAPFG